MILLCKFVLVVRMFLFFDVVVTVVNIKEHANMMLLVLQTAASARTPTALVLVTAAASQARAVQ